MKRKRVLYLDVAEKLKADIYANKYPVGTMLPTETELEELFGVSKITVRKAIELLATDEYVEKKSGKGTTVLSNRPYNKLSKAASFTQILENSDVSVTKEITGLAVVKTEKNTFLYQSFGAKVLCYQRLYKIDNQPYIYFTHYLPVEMKQFTEKDFATESLYRLLMKKGFFIESFQDDFQAIYLSEEQATILDTSEKIAIQRTRKSVDQHHQLVEYSEAIYETNRRPYTIEYEA